MTTNAIQRLQYLISIIPGKMSTLSEADLCHKPAENKWSKKEILGHLIDSAANNHHRFIRVQYEDVPTIVYDQDHWNNLSGYNEMSSNFVINLWAQYNQLLVNIIKRIPAAHLTRECNTGSNVTLQWLIDDYVVHMEHHLREIVDY